tara:strand:+ start:43 stop:237 length:195 start_codon:yes stop_codon:yes gene_type:complete
MSDALQRLEDLGKQLAQEEQIQKDLQNRFKESTERATKINEELTALARNTANPETASDGEACPA